MTAKSPKPQSETKTFTVKGYGAPGGLIGGKSLELMDVVRHQPRENEVLIEILYCGVCHSDAHQCANDWKNTIYPCIPGHEVIGKVVKAGNSVSKFKEGDIVGVGCMIDSCGSCAPCKAGEEHYCTGPVSWTATYNGYMQPQDKEFNTFGGYSTHMTVQESFCLRIPETLDVRKVAPILCAGVTTYSPLRHAKVGAGSKVGIVGIGGLGHMGVMLAKAMGAHVTAITTSEEKREAALELGADSVLLSEDESMMKAAELSLDFILVTIPVAFDVNPYVCLLKPHGSLVTVGLLGPYKEPLNNMDVAFKGRSVGGSLIGSLKETQEVLDFCAEHGILPQTEMIRIQNINDAFDKVKDEDVRFRYVIDMASLKDDSTAAEKASLQEEVAA